MQVVEPNCRLLRREKEEEVGGGLEAEEEEMEEMEWVIRGALLLLPGITRAEEKVGRLSTARRRRKRSGVLPRGSRVLLVNDWSCIVVVCLFPLLI